MKELRMANCEWRMKELRMKTKRLSDHLTI